MDIDRCNSIFELFAAFNFTYAVLSGSSNGNSIETRPADGDENNSDSKENEPNKSLFVEIIDNRLLTSFTFFLKRGSNLCANLLNKITSMETILKNHPGNEQILADKIELSIMNNLVEVWTKEVFEKKKNKRKRINDTFPFISFYLAIFCVSVIGIGISESSIKHFSLMLLDGSAVLIYIYIILKGEKNDYFKLTLWIILSIIIIGSTHILMNANDDSQHWIFDFLFSINNQIENDKVFKMIIIIVAIILPFAHFIYYFIILGIANISIQNSSSQLIETYEKQYSEFASKNVDKWKKFGVGSDYTVK